MIPLTGKAAAFQFCQSAHLKGEVWFKASWNSSNPLPVWWERKKDGSPVNYVYKGNVDPDRQQLTLVLCRYGGTDENGDTIWLPTRTHFVDGHRHLSELTELGATVFFYANQPIGGISNNHVQAPGLFFYEVDHLSLEEQWQALDRFIERTGLEPCAVIFTGGKSLHVYFRPNRPLTPEEWHELNWKLTIVQDGDPAINNLARAMRWPGLVRVKDGVSTHISLERYSDASYSPEEIRRALDSTNLFPHGCSKEHQRLWRNAALKQRRGEDVDPLDVLLKPESELYPKLQSVTSDRRYSTTNSSPVPLQICLSRANQELLAGNSEGDRDNGGYRLAKDLIGAYNTLRALGIPCQDDPQILFEQYSQSCNPPLNPRDQNRIWHSANRLNPTSAIGEEAIQRRVSYYQWQQQPRRLRVETEDEQSGDLTNSDRRISQEEWQVKHGLGNAVRQAFTRLHQKFANIFEKKRPQQATPKPLAIIGDRIVEADQLIDAAAESTKQYVLIAVDGGVGKSHQAGLAFPQQFGVDKLLYISNSGRNPTTGSVEQNFVEMPVRHDGLKIDPNRTTPSGVPFIVWPNAGDHKEIEANCSRTQIFHALSGKNIENIEDSNSPVCEGCHLVNMCKHSSGNGYGYKHKRRIAIQADRIRLHFDSLPSVDKFDYSKAGMIIDEAGENARFIKQTAVVLADLDKNLAILAANNLINENTQPFFNALRSILSGDTKQPYHGLDEALLRELLPLPAILDELIEAIKKLTEPNLEFLDTKDSIDYEGMGAKDRKGLGRWSRLLEKESAVNAWQAQKEIADSVVKNFLPLLLEILAGTRRGSLRCDRRVLTIAIPNERQLEVVRAAKKVVFMDGTLTRERLAFRLGCKPEEIEVIRAKQPDYSNAQWIQVVGLGHCGGHNPTDTMKARLAVLRQTYTKQDPLTVFTYFKSLVEDESADGAWWVDSRGSNRFAGIANRVTFGTPYKNLGALQLEFNAFSGRCAELGDKNKGTDTDPHLQQFIDEEVQAAFIQDFWRQRSHRHPDKQFRYVSVTDYPLEFVQAALPGVQFTQIDAFSVNPAAGSDKEQTLWAMGQALKTAAEQGIKATQSAIADLAGISLAYVKKLAQEWGGWANLKEGILALLLSFNSGSIPFSEPLDDEEQFFKDWLPVVVEEGVAGDEEMTAIAAANVGSAFNLLGCKRFIKVLRASALQVRAEALGLVLALLPSNLKRDLSS